MTNRPRALVPMTPRNAAQGLRPREFLGGSLAHPARRGHQLPAMTWYRGLMMTVQPPTDGALNFEGTDRRSGRDGWAARPAQFDVSVPIVSGDRATGAPPAGRSYSGGCWYQRVAAVGHVADELAGAAGGARENLRQGRHPGARHISRGAPARKSMKVMSVSVPAGR